MKKPFILILILLLIIFFSFIFFITKQKIILKEKIGQMLIIGFKGTELHPDDAIVKTILAQNIGGVILFDYNLQTKTYERNIKNPTQLQRLTHQLQDYATQAAANHKNDLIPLFISIDYEGGNVTRLPEKLGFPKTKSEADISQLSDKAAEQQAEQMVRLLKQEGINMNFMPVLDVNNNPENPVIGKEGRSFSSDPHTVVHYAALFSKRYHDNGIICVYKHFPGHGSSTGDTHAGFVDVTHTWKENELYPYEELLKRSYHCPMIMMAHVVHYGLDSQGYPASLSYAMTTQLLRNKFKFKGLIVTDDMQMKAITDNYGLRDAVRLAVNAGADILILGNQLVPTAQDPRQIIDMIYDDVTSGKILEKRIDESYQRIVKLKKELRQATPKPN